MQQVFSIPKAFKENFKYTFCPGCDHGIAIRLIGEVIDELGIIEDIITWDRIIDNKIEIIKKLNFKEFKKIRETTDFSNIATVVLKPNN